MHNIGIMQGRVRPERPDVLQCFPRSQWRRELLEIRALGFDSVELLADRDLACRVMLADRMFRQECRTLSSSVCADVLTTVSSQKQPDAFHSALDRLACITGALGVRTIVVPFFGENKIPTADELIAVLRELPEMADCTVAIEVDLPANEMNPVLDRTGFGVCYDLGNARAAGRTPEEEILQLGDRIIHVHVKDRCVGGPNVPLGEGDVDFDACFSALERIGYSGDFILETAGGDDPHEAASRHLEFVRERIAGVPA